MHGYVRNPDGSFGTIDAPGAATTGTDALGTNINRINSAGAMAGVYFGANRARHGFARE
jgi:hypothetical protein